MFKLQSPSQDSPFDAIHLLRYFFHCSKLFLNSLILMSFSVLAIFLFYLFHMGKMFPFEDFFMAGGGGRGINRSHSGWRGRVGYGGHAVFSQKLQNTQRGVGRCTCKSPIMKWANMLKESSKKIQINLLKPNAASHNTTSWYTDTDEFLEHSRSGESLCYKEPTLQK